MRTKAWSRRWFKRVFSEEMSAYVQNRFLPVVDRYLGPLEGTILDAGCSWRNSFWVAEKMNCSESVGMDIDKEALSRNIVHDYLICLDLHQMSVENRFDGIISAYTWEHLRNPYRVLGNFFRALKAGGFLVIIAANRWSYESFLERVLPRKMKDFSWRVLRGKKSMPYPAYYHLCTKKSLVKAAAGIGFSHLHFFSLEGPSLWLARIPPLFLLSSCWMRIANRFSFFEPIRGEFIAVFRKNSAQPVIPR